MAHLPKQGKRQRDADARPSITRCQVDLTSIPMSSKPKLNTKKSGGGVPAAKVTESDNISDQVPCGKRQVPHHVRYATLPIVQPRQPYVHS